MVERPDLDKLAYKSCELESKFVELVKGNCKNFIIGCIYRHPLMSGDEFNDDFLTPLFK